MSSNVERVERIDGIFATNYNYEGSDPTDLLADLMHWLDSEQNVTGQAFEDHLRIARMHYEAEKS